MSKGYKMGVYGGGTGNTLENPAFNATVFATHDEADRAGRELLSRWYGPTGHCVVEVDEEPDYEFPVGASRPSPIPYVVHCAEEKGYWLEDFGWVGTVGEATGYVYPNLSIPPLRGEYVLRTKAVDYPDDDEVGL